VFTRKSSRKGMEAQLKRSLDVVASASVLLLGAPVFGVVACCIVADSGRPVFFSQLRVGRGGQLFRLWKFRSMSPKVSGPHITVCGDPRITRFGRLMRRTKLDEFAQFWNVLIGDMSLVGPRPEVPEYVAMFPDRYARVLQVRPGITDLASIEFRDEERILAMSENPGAEYVQTILPAKLDLAEEYVRRQSLWLDLKILCRTALAVAR
jgi:lipopolysaccharide/colanic/teichoic acid biosynthesis glycosyltransferase